MKKQSIDAINKDVFKQRTFAILIWAIAALFVLYQFLLQASSSIMVPELMRAFSIDAVQVGILSSAYYYTYVFLQMPAGMLVDRVGSRHLLIWGALGLAIGCAWFAISTHFYGALASRMFMGIVASPGIVATLFLAKRWFAPHQFALIAGLTEMFGMFGAGVGEPALSYLVAGSFGWKGTVAVCSIFGVGLAVLVFLLVHDKPKYVGNIQQFEKTTQERFSLVFKKIIFSQETWILGIYSGLMFTIVATFASLWAVPFLRELYQSDLTTAAALTSMIFIGAGIGAPLIGWFSDYIKRRKPLMVMGSILTMALMFIVLYVEQIPMVLMFILLFLSGFVSSVYMIPFAVMSDITPNSRHAAAMGFTNMMCIIIGAPLLQPIIGAVLQNLHPATILYSVDDYRTALMLLPVGLSIALLLTLRLRETHPQANTMIEETSNVIPFTNR